MLFNRKRLLPIPVYLPGMRVDKSAHFILISLDSLGAKLKWDGQMLQIEASESMWNKTAGLCGTMNDDPNDEFLMKSGDHVRSISALANSWRVDDLGGNNYNYNLAVYIIVAVDKRLLCFLIKKETMKSN